MTTSGVQGIPTVGDVTPYNQNIELSKVMVILDTLA